MLVNLFNHYSLLAVNLSNFSMSEKYDPIISQRNTSNEINSINSNQIDSSRNQKIMKINNNNNKKKKQ